MEPEIREKQRAEQMYSLPTVIILASAMLSVAWIYTSKLSPEKKAAQIAQTASASEVATVSPDEEAVLPSSGIELPVTWGDLGAKLSSVGVIDAKRFEQLYSERGEYSEAYKKLLYENNPEKLRMTASNAGYLLNLFWALGLASKNPVLDSGEMANPRYGGAGNFASTGGWTMAQGNPMDHYSRHKFFNLMPEQQALVEKISKGIYRPCCNNSTHFPDCNHGMAMLGLLELMASQGVSEQEMWQAALAVNSYWFPDTYLTIATYMKNKSVEWKDVKPEEILGENYSSGSGYQKIASQVVITQSNSQGGGCDVSAGQSVSVPQQKQSGCGI